MSSLGNLTVGQLLAAVASDAPTPGGGAVGALVLAQAAALAAMAGRFAIRSSGGPGGCDDPSDPDGPDGETFAALVVAADRLRAAAAALADADADAYAGYLAALRIPRESEPAARSRAVAEATARAVEVPLATARAGARVVELAMRLVERGNPRLRADAAGAALLASAAATTAAIMAVENLAKDPGDPRATEAVAAARTARAGADRAVAAFPALAVPS